MKHLPQLVLATVIIFCTSCASTVKFPVSSVTPAAEIAVKMKKDDNKNNVIEISATNLASPDRLNPPKNNYIVWIVTENNGTKNIGQLINKNGKKSYLKSSTPFPVKEVFITAEDKGDVAYPSGVEISRTNVHSK